MDGGGHAFPVHGCTDDTSGVTGSFGAGVEIADLGVLESAAIAGDADRAGGPAFGGHQDGFVGEVAALAMAAGHLFTKFLECLL